MLCCLWVLDWTYMPHGTHLTSSERTVGSAHATHGSQGWFQHTCSTQGCIQHLQYIGPDLVCTRCLHCTSPVWWTESVGLICGSNTAHGMPSCHSSAWHSCLRGTQQKPLLWGNCGEKITFWYQKCKGSLSQPVWSVSCNFFLAAGLGS